MPRISISLPIRATTILGIGWRSPGTHTLFDNGLWTLSDDHRWVKTSNPTVEVSVTSIAGDDQVFDASACRTEAGKVWRWCAGGWPYLAGRCAIRSTAARQHGLAFTARDGIECGKPDK
jgi:hypothetical protein